MDRSGGAAMGLVPTMVNDDILTTLNESLNLPMTEEILKHPQPVRRLAVSPRLATSRCGRCM